MVFLDEQPEEHSEVFVEAGVEGGVVAEFWELAIDCPDDLDVVVLDEVKVFLLVLL